jgi:hypothetical protein
VPTFPPFDYRPFPGPSGFRPPTSGLTSSNVFTPGYIDVCPTSLSSLERHLPVSWAKREARYGVSSNAILTTKGISPCIAVAVATVPPQFAGLMHIHPTASEATIRSQVRSMLKAITNGSSLVAYVRGGAGGHPFSKRTVDAVFAELDNSGVTLEADETLTNYNPAAGTCLAIDPRTNKLYRDMR